MDSAEQDIISGQYNLVSKILYGGICSGAIVIPTNFIKVIFYSVKLFITIKYTYLKFFV
jgi:hypothetical protein